MINNFRKENSMEVDRILNQYFTEYVEEVYAPLRGIEREKNRLAQEVTKLREEIARLRWSMEEHD